MKREPSYIEAEFILKEATRKNELQRLATATRFEYYSPRTKKDWMRAAAFVTPLVFISWKFHQDGKAHFILTALVLMVVLLEVQRIEQKIDAIRRLQEMKEEETNSTPQRSME